MVVNRAPQIRHARRRRANLVSNTREQVGRAHAGQTNFAAPLLMRVATDDEGHRSASSL
jgi:hypothetical protein